MTKQEFISSLDFFDEFTIYTKDIEKLIECIKNDDYESALLLTHPNV